MAAFEYDHDLGVFAKTCPRCQKTFEGTNEQVSSEILFKKFFWKSNRGDGDGFQNACKECGSDFRRIRESGAQREFSISKRLASQGGKCDICQVDVHSPGRYPNDPFRACLDHNHSTLVVRGILCDDCNRLIGWYERIKERASFRLSELEKYLDRWENADSTD